MRNSEDTIFALASAHGRAGVAVVRISGKAALTAVDMLCGSHRPLEPRKAHLRDLKDLKTGEKIDRAIALFFSAPNSFTGEDVVELHVHGGRSVIGAVYENLARIKGFRMAEPGEFTRRAFENGKMDLTEAEAIADLVDAETSAQRRQALRQMDGELGRLYGNWSERLKECLAYIEAEIDFADDELPPDFTGQKLEELKKLRDEIATHLNDGRRGERLREGFSVAILGAPNAGKSSLLNAVARREAAIVSSVPGTTRDVIEVPLDIGGYPFLLADTAGLRETKDEIEQEGVRRASKKAEEADFRILVFDGEKIPEMDEETLKFSGKDSIWAISKADKITNREAAGNPIFISALTGEGLDKLSETLVSLVKERFSGASQPSLTRARHREALEECRENLDRALSVEQSELRAEDARLAMRALGRITGQVGVEDVLDVIFRDFCLGK